MEKLEINFGCKHYKRKCKIFCDCCNEIFSCDYVMMKNMSMRLIVIH